MSVDKAGPAAETEITAAGVGAVAGPPSTVLNSVGFSVPLRAQDISGALGTGQGVAAPVPGVSSLHTHLARLLKAPCLPSCQRSSGKDRLAE